MVGRVNPEKRIVVVYAIKHEDADLDKRATADEEDDGEASIVPEEEGKQKKNEDDAAIKLEEGAATENTKEDLWRQFVAIERE